MSHNVLCISGNLKTVTVNYCTKVVQFVLMSCHEAFPYRPLCQLTVWDNGVGFQADRPRPGGAGLELASTIVREKLTGEWSVESGPGGTRISFDFLEQ